MSKIPEIPKPDKRRIEAITGKIYSALESALNHELPEFDPDLSIEHPTNQRAAEAHNLKYDLSKESYVDCSGCLVRDKFGQPF